MRLSTCLGNGKGRPGEGWAGVHAPPNRARDQDHLTTAARGLSRAEACPRRRQAAPRPPAALQARNPPLPQTGLHPRT